MSNFQSLQINYSDNPDNFDINQESNSDKITEFKKPVKQIKAIKAKIKTLTVKHTAYSFNEPSWLNGLTENSINDFICSMNLDKKKLDNDFDYFYLNQKLISKEFNLSLSKASYFLFNYLKFSEENSK